MPCCPPPALAALMLALMVPAVAAPGWAQTIAQRPPAALPDPAPTPPASALLVAPTPHGPARPPSPPLTLSLPQGMSALPQGGWRLRFAGDIPSLEVAALPALAELGRQLGAKPQGRVSLLAQASGPVSDISAARRLSLARALAVKQALAAGGLAATRIDIRALGHIAEGQDAVDILPPGSLVQVQPQVQSGGGQALSGPGR